MKPRMNLSPQTAAVVATAKTKRTFPGKGMASQTSRPAARMKPKMNLNTIVMAFKSAGKKLECRQHSLRFCESLDPLPRSFRRVLLAIRRSNCVANARAAWHTRSHTDFTFPNLNCSTRFLLKRTKPSGRLIVPGAHKDSAIDDDNPHAGVTVFGSAANAENLCVAYLFDERVVEFIVLRHGSEL